jgi:predicted nucleic acid-binding protein
LTDTDILIDAACGLPQASAFLAQQQPAGVRISVISAMELVRVAETLWDWGSWSGS